MADVETRYGFEEMSHDQVVELATDLMKIIEAVRAECAAQIRQGNALMRSDDTWGKNFGEGRHHAAVDILDVLEGH